MSVPPPPQSSIRGPFAYDLIGAPSWMSRLRPQVRRAPRGWQVRIAVKAGQTYEWHTPCVRTYEMDLVNVMDVTRPDQPEPTDMRTWRTRWGASLWARHWCRRTYRKWVRWQKEDGGWEEL